MRLDEAREGMRVRSTVGIPYAGGEMAPAGTFGRVVGIGSGGIVNTECDGIDPTLSYYPQELEIVTESLKPETDRASILTDAVRLETEPDKSAYHVVITDEMRQNLVLSKMGLEITVAKLREENERLRAGLDAMDGATEVGRLGISHRTEKPWYVYDGPVEYHAYRGGECKPFHTASEAYLYACDVLAKEDQP